jgi:hypothetical protein
VTKLYASDKNKVSDLVKSYGKSIENMLSTKQSKLNSSSAEIITFVDLHTKLHTFSVVANIYSYLGDLLTSHLLSLKINVINQSYISPNSEHESLVPAYRIVQTMLPHPFTAENNTLEQQIAPPANAASDGDGNDDSNNEETQDTTPKFTFYPLLIHNGRINFETKVTNKEYIKDQQLYLLNLSNKSITTVDSTSASDTSTMTVIDQALLTFYQAIKVLYTEAVTIFNNIYLGGKVTDSAAAPTDEIVQADVVVSSGNANCLQATCTLLSLGDFERMFIGFGKWTCCLMLELVVYFV